MYIRPVLGRSTAFRGLACSVIEIAARPAPEVAPEVAQALQRSQSQNYPSGIHSTEQVVLQLPDTTLQSDVIGGVPPSITFWRSLVCKSEDVTSKRNNAQVPSSLLEFFCKCPPLTMKQKSFMFTCVFSSSDGSPPEPRDIICPRLTEHLSSCHLLELLDERKLNVNEPHLLRYFDMEDRLQYLRESEHHEAVEQLERSRWLYLDAGKEATYSSLQQLQTTILVDMSMLLLWQRSSSTSEQNNAASFVVGLAMMFLAMEGSGDSDVRLAYYFIQQAFQSVRCGYLALSSKHISVAVIASALLEECQVWIQQGWSRFTRLWKPQSLPSPAGARFFCKHNLLKSGLWPILLNPFKLSGRKWADVGHQSPFNGLKAHCALKEAVFTLDPELLTCKINTEEAAAPYENRIAALKTFIAQEFDRPPLMLVHQKPRPWSRTRPNHAPSDADAMMRLNIPSSWILRSPTTNPTLISDIEWMEDDPEKIRIRTKLALYHCMGLVVADQASWCMQWTAVNQQLASAHKQLRTILSAVIRFCPGCCCHLIPPSDECRADTLDLLSRFTVMVPKDYVSACFDKHSRFSEYDEAGYSAEELESVTKNPPSSVVLWPFEELESASCVPEYSSMSRLRRVLLHRQAKAATASLARGCAPNVEEGSKSKYSAASKAKPRKWKEAPVKKRRGRGNYDKINLISSESAESSVELESSAESLESCAAINCLRFPMTVCTSSGTRNAFTLGEISTKNLSATATSAPFAACSF